jgi:hypothetical protein
MDNRRCEIERLYEIERLHEIERLYRQAFAEYGVMALWSSRPVERPGAADALAITESLRVQGNRDARRLAERIEALCRAAD